MATQQPRREILVRRLTDDQVRVSPGIDTEVNFEAHCNAGDKIFFFTNLGNIKNTNNIKEVSKIIIYCKNRNGDYRFAKGIIHYIETTENDIMINDFKDDGFVFVWGKSERKI